MANSFLTWQDEFNVGHRGLDVEHQRIVEIINQISEAGSDRAQSQQLLSLLTELYRAALAHFRHENSIMRDILTGAYQLANKSPDQLTKISEAIVNEHCAEHAREIIQLEKMRCAFSDDQERARASLAKELKDWFVDHALKHDVHLRSVFRANNSDLAAISIEGRPLR